VAVVEVESETPDEEELAAAYREASESASELGDQCDGTSDEAWSGLDE
jgi:adenylate cyclase class IV